MFLHPSVRVAVVVLVLTLGCRQNGGVTALGEAATAPILAGATATAAGAGGAREAAAAATREARVTPTIPATSTAASTSTPAAGGTVNIDCAALLARGGGKYGEAGALNGAAQTVSLFGPEEKVRTNAASWNLSKLICRPRIPKNDYQVFCSQLPHVVANPWPFAPPHPLPEHDKQFITSECYQYQYLYFLVFDVTNKIWTLTLSRSTCSVWLMIRTAPTNAHKLPTLANILLRLATVTAILCYTMLKLVRSVYQTRRPQSKQRNHNAKTRALAYIYFVHCFIVYLWSPKRRLIFKSASAISNYWPMLLPPVWYRLKY